MIDRRFIEESFPVKEVGEVAARDSGSSPVILESSIYGGRENP